MSTSLQLNGLWPTRLLRPWDSPGKSPGWVAVPFSRGFSWPRNWTWVSRIVGRLFTIWATREAPCSSKLGHKCGIGLVSKPCLTLCDPTDCSPLGSSVHGILQARTLEWVAISFSRGSSRPRDWICISYISGGFFTSESPGEPRS